MFLPLNKFPTTGTSLIPGVFVLVLFLVFFLIPPITTISPSVTSNFVLISLYVDDRTDLSEDDKFKFINQSGKIQYISNVGRRWSLFQQINFKNASKRLKNSEEFVLKALKVNASVINEVNASIKHDLKFINKAFKTNPNILIHLDEKFFNSIGFEIDFAKAMFAVSFNGILLTHLDESFKENEAIIEAALTNNTSAINYISEKKYKKYKKYLKHLDSDDDIPF